MDVTSVYTKYLKEEVSLGLVKVGRNPRLSLPSLSTHTHKHTHKHTQEFCLTDFLSELCVCVNATGENAR